MKVLLSILCGLIALFALFALLHAATGTFDFGAPGQVVAARYRDAAFVLALAWSGLPVSRIERRPSAKSRLAKP